MAVSKRNRRGIFWLFVLCIVIAIIPRLISELNGHPGFTVSESELIERSEELGESIAARTADDSKKRYKKRAFVRPHSKFNPNDYGVNDWKKLGLSEKQANVVVKFSARGLRSQEDVKRIFVIPSELYEMIKDSMLFPKQEMPQQEKVKPVLRIELNTADQSEFEKLPGIGSYFSKKMVEYRDQLGGYLRVDQLLELYKMDSTKWNQIKPYLTVDAQSIRKLNINEATYEELRNHPYIDATMANSIVKMRKQKGKYTAITEIRESKVIADSSFLKIKPYLSIE